MKIHKGLVLVSLLAAIGLRSQQRPVDMSALTRYVDQAGNIERPRDYRKGWTHLGTYFVTGSDQSKTMHSVYTEQRNIDAYNRSGRWPDGTVLVKEVTTADGGELTTGAANWAAEPVVWFVSVKDAEGRFPSNPLWGDGWGWALFQADAPDVQVATNYKTDCLTCHLPARQSDLVFVEGYPPLRGESANAQMGPARMMAGSPMMAAADEVVPTGSAEKGAEVFAQVCGVCHSLQPGRKKVGPSLAPIATEQRLPSGAEATPENLLRQINDGGHGMPAFARHLNAQQKADLVAFVRNPH